MFKYFIIAALALLFSSATMASGGNGHGHRHYPHYRQPHFQRNYAPAFYPPPGGIYYREEIRYYPERIIRYESIPHYQPAPHYERYDGRTATGLVGGALGGIVGYEIGRGDPLAVGIGAAAGSLLGNGMRR